MPRKNPYLKPVWSLPDGDRVVSHRPDGTPITANEANRFMWETGLFLAQKKLKYGQLRMWEVLNSPDMPKLSRPFLQWARRTGKTTLEVVDFEIFARMNPNSILRFAGPTQKQVISTIIPIWNDVVIDCPPDLRAKYNQIQGCYIWPNGSRLYIAGTDNEQDVDRLRGPRANRIYVDELGFHRCNLERLIDSVLSPQLNTTKGIMVLSTTPPDTNSHGSVEYINRARKRGVLYTKNILDVLEDCKQDRAPLFQPDDVRRFCEEANPNAEPAEVDRILRLGNKLEQGGATPAWEREYLCRLVTDKRLRVVPDFDPAKHSTGIHAPPYTTHYVFIDQAQAHDFCALIFASHDFATNTLYVEDEWLCKRPALDFLAVELRKKESELWGDDDVRRYDDDPRGQLLRQELGRRGLPVTKGPKSQGVESAANRLTVAIREGKIKVHERCIHLTTQMTDGIWKVTEGGGKMDFDRNATEGHLDALAALAMGVRCVDWRHNAMPDATVSAANAVVMLNPMRQGNETKRVFSRIFRRNILNA